MRSLLPDFQIKQRTTAERVMILLVFFSHPQQHMRTFLLTKASLCCVAWLTSKGVVKGSKMNSLVKWQASDQWSEKIFLCAAGLQLIPPKLFPPNRAVGNIQSFPTFLESNQKSISKLLTKIQARLTVVYYRGSWFNSTWQEPSNPLDPTVPGCPFKGLAGFHVKTRLSEGEHLTVRDNLFTSEENLIFKALCVSPSPTNSEHMEAISSSIPKHWLLLSWCQ